MAHRSEVGRPAILLRRGRPTRVALRRGFPAPHRSLRDDLNSGRAEVQVVEAERDLAHRLFDEEKYQEALPKLLDSAAGGDVAALARLGWMYQAGKGVGVDKGRAEEYYAAAAAAGGRDEAYGFARLLSHLGRYEESAQWYRRAIAESHLGAMYALGRLAEQGKISLRGSEEARQLMRDAAKGGHVWARRYLAMRRLRGEDGVAYIPLGLIELLRTAASGFRIASEDLYDNRLSE